MNALQGWDALADDLMKSDENPEQL